VRRSRRVDRKPRGCEGGFGVPASRFGAALSGFGAAALAAAMMGRAASPHGYRQPGGPMDVSKLNFVAIGVATVIAFMLGGLWYSPILFARLWMREAGLNEQQIQQANMAKVFGLSALATLVMACNLAAFIGPQADLAFGLFAGLAAGIGWIAMSLGVIYLFEQRSLKLWLVNSGYQVLAYALMGAILGAWK
jgi:hypothetical protein